MKQVVLNRFFAALVCGIVGGCGGFGGAIGGAAVSGVLTGSIVGEALNPLYWPFEDARELLVFECGGKPTEIAVTSGSAIFYQEGGKILFYRDYAVENDQRLLYYAVKRLDQGEEELFDDETNEEPYTLDWLEVLDDQTVELTVDDVSIACEETPEDPQS